MALSQEASSPVGLPGGGQPRAACASVAGAVSLVASVLTGGVLAGAVARRRADARAVTPAATHTIGFDQYSLLIDGRRTFIWSGEFHPFRLPSPDLWRDVLQKMKASGYN